MFKSCPWSKPLPWAGAIWQGRTTEWFTPQVLGPCPQGVAMFAGQCRHALAMPQRLRRSHANAERGVVPQHFALFCSICVFAGQRCLQTTAGVMEDAVGHLCLFEFSTGPTGTKQVEIWALHCGALRISAEARFSEAAVLSSNRRGQWNSVFEKSCFFEN